MEELLPAGSSPPVSAYLENYIQLTRWRLPQFAAGTSSWWLEHRPFFGGLVRPSDPGPGVDLAGRP